MKANAWNNRNKIELRQCSSCGFVYSIVSEFKYTEFCSGVYAAKTKDEILSLAYQQNIDKLVSDIIHKSKINYGGRMLDFGCGIGLTALCFQEHGFETFGVEQSNPFLQKHKELNIKSSNSLKEFNDEKGTFDIIVLKDVLEHIDFPVETLRSLISYLKPNGYFYIRVPNVYHYPFHWSIDTKGHINHFTPNILYKLMLSNNMEKVDFINVYDIKTKAGKIYHAVFWNLRNIFSMYHQISILYRKA